jgi:hypothetical protein
MKTVADLLKNGCYFCKEPLTAETALMGTVSYALARTDKWCRPFVVATCSACAEKHAEEGEGHADHVPLEETSETR